MVFVHNCCCAGGSGRERRCRVLAEREVMRERRAETGCGIQFVAVLPFIPSGVSWLVVAVDALKIREEPSRKE